MRPTISQLRGWNLDGLAQAAKTGFANAMALDTAVDQALRVFYATDWSGETRAAARTKLEQEADHIREVRNVLQTYADEAADAARGLQAARAYVLGLVDHRDQSFDVSDTGEVTCPDPDRLEHAQQLQLRIQLGLDEVERLDNQYGPILAGIANDLASLREGQRDVAVPGGGTADPDAVVDRLVGMSPAERRAFLAQMSPADIHQLVLADPERLGGLDGVPFAIRIGANEINIRNALVDEKQRPDPDPARVERLEAMLAPINDPHSTDSRDQQGVPPSSQVDRKFITFSTEGNGRFIEMVGELRPGISGAAVYVPGTNTNLNGSDGNTTAAWNLANKSNAPVFLYVDGDLPQGFVDAIKPRYAEDMAPKLVGFGSELDIEIAQQAPGTKTTYIGHSYGGSVVGSAEQLGLNADRIVHASSSGSGVYQKEWANPNPEVQRFSMTAPGDPVGMVQSIPQKIQTTFPIVSNLPGNPHGGHPAGTDPDEIPGVTRLDTGYYHPDFGKDTNDPARRDLAGEVVFGRPGHGEYWNDPGSDAFQNLVGVISGGSVTTYVERGVETDTIDVDLGDDGDFADEAYDQSRVLMAGYDGPIPLLPPLLRPSDPEPFADPRVTDNPGPGRKIDVE